MSHSNKLSLWQKIKRLLTSAALSVAEVAGAKNTHHDISPAEASDEHLHANLNTKTDADTKTDSETQNVKSDATDSLDTPTAASNDNDTPITDYLKQYLHDKQWHYIHYRPKANDSQQSQHLSLHIRHQQQDCDYLFRIQESNALLAVYGILPFLIPQSHHNAAILLITQINYDMLVGNLEMDVNDGEIRYKNAIDIEAVGISNDIIEHLLQSVVAMTTITYEIFSDLVNTQEPAEDMPTLLDELRQQADDRTFFLPTQFVQ